MDNVDLLSGCSGGAASGAMARPHRFAFRGQAALKEAHPTAIARSRRAAADAAEPPICVGFLKILVLYDSDCVRLLP